MAERTPKRRASYGRGCDNAAALRTSSDHDGLALELRAIPLLHRGIKRIHIDVDDFSLFTFRLHFLL